MISATTGESRRAAMSGPESSAAASTSTSPIVSRNRRSDPAWVHRRQPGAADTAATISSARPSAVSSSTRSPDCRSSRMPCRMFSSVLGPNP
ncbi:hypothetical protein ACFSVJ_04315 [Prauserella oleivorans]